MVLAFQRNRNAAAIVREKSTAITSAAARTDLDSGKTDQIVRRLAHVRHDAKASTMQIALDAAAVESLFK